MQAELNELSGKIIARAMRVHSALGPGLLESAYESCLAYELRQCRLRVRTQVAVPLRYGASYIEVAYRIDILVEEAIVVELKTVTALLPIHEAQLLTQLRLGNYRLGLLLNFYVTHMRDGIKRIVNGL